MTYSLINMHIYWLTEHLDVGPRCIPHAGSVGEGREENFLGSRAAPVGPAVGQARRARLLLAAASGALHAVPIRGSPSEYSRARQKSLFCEYFSHASAPGMAHHALAAVARLAQTYLSWHARMYTSRYCTVHMGPIGKLLFGR